MMMKGTMKNKMDGQVDHKEDSPKSTNHNHDH
jgi:hypothetical protein